MMLANTMAVVMWLGVTCYALFGGADFGGIGFFMMALVDFFLDAVEPVFHAHGFSLSKNDYRICCK